MSMEFVKLITETSNERGTTILSTSTIGHAYLRQVLRNPERLPCHKNTNVTMPGNGCIRIHGAEVYENCC